MNIMPMKLKWNINLCEGQQNFRLIQVCPGIIVILISYAINNNATATAGQSLAIQISIVAQVSSLEQWRKENMRP